MTSQYLIVSLNSLNRTS